MSVAAPLVLREGDRARLEALTRSTSVRAGLALRARIVLLAAEGLANAEIARRTGSTRPTVLAWRNRYAVGGIDALGDKPRSGRPARVNEIEVVATTLADGGRPPASLGASHWSARLLGIELGISFATVARIWRKWGIQPHRIDTFRPSVGAELESKAVELYRNPAELTAVLQRRGTAGAGTEPQPTAAPALQPDPWLNLVEVSLGILIHQAIRRGTFASVHNLIEAIGALTDGWNDQEDPSTHRPRSPVLVQRNRKGTSNTAQSRARSSRPTVDLRKSPLRPAGRPADPLSLRAEFHGSRCRWPGTPDEPETPGRHSQGTARPVEQVTEKNSHAAAIDNYSGQ